MRTKSSVTRKTAKICKVCPVLVKIECRGVKSYARYDEII